MTPQEVVQAALRVLSAWSSGHRPALNDVAILREQSLPPEALLPIDNLACLVVKRACESVIRGNGQSYSFDESKKLQLTVNGPVRFAVNGDKLRVVDEKGKEHTRRPFFRRQLTRNDRSSTKCLRSSVVL